MIRHRQHHHENDCKHCPYQDKWHTSSDLRICLVRKCTKHRKQEYRKHVVHCHQNAGYRFFESK